MQKAKSAPSKQEVPKARPEWRKHDTFSMKCWCKPVRDVLAPNMIIHNDARDKS